MTDWTRECVAACEYQLHWYVQAEKTQRAVGLVSARAVELSLRWDGVSNYAGRGFQVVSEAVKPRASGGCEKVSEAAK